MFEKLFDDAMGAHMPCTRWVVLMFNAAINERVQSLGEALGDALQGRDELDDDTKAAFQTPAPVADVFPVRALSSVCVASACHQHRSQWRWWAACVWMPQ